MVKTICTNLLNKEGETTTTVREFTTLKEAQRHASCLAEAKSVLEVMINDGNEITVVKENATVNNATKEVAMETKTTIRMELRVLGIELTETKFKKTKKEELVAMLKEAKAQQVQIDAQEQQEEVQAQAQETITDNHKTILSIDDAWNADTATKVLVKILEMAKNNNYISFISHHMATSAMCEVLVGRPLKDRITRKENQFSDEEKKLVAEFRNRFAEKYLIMNERGTGYNIKSVGMTWYYKKVVYRYQNKAQIVDYIVDFRAKTITRKDGTGKQTTLDAVAFKKLDDTCTFIKVCK